MPDILEALEASGISYVSIDISKGARATAWKARPPRGCMNGYGDTIRAALENLLGQLEHWPSVTVESKPSAVADDPLEGL